MVSLKNKNLVTVNEFAELFSYSPNHVRRLIHEGQIPATRLNLGLRKNGAWRIDLDAVNLETNEIDYHETNVFNSSTNNIQQRKTDQNSSDYLKNLDQY